MTRSATAVAHANIALAKYWGKRDEVLALPATSSLSLTLDAFRTTTTVTVGDLPAGSADTGTLDGAPMTGDALGRVQRFLDLVRGLAGSDAPASVVSTATVPTGAGLASSASGFAALAGAATAAYGLDLDPRALSRLARRGSGSASRSVFGGLVVWHAGTNDLTSYAEPVPSGVKSVSSRVAMKRTVETSPFFDGWVESTEQDVATMLDLIAAGDLAAVGDLAESNALRMHATMLGARPPVRYWTGHTMTVLDEVQALRADGLPCWATMDAGPNVKVLCAGRDLDAVAAALAGGPDGLAGRRVVTARPGPDLRVEVAA
jgi:diphosphomevalonate decarboxylase